MIQTVFFPKILTSLGIFQEATNPLTTNQLLIEIDILRWYFAPPKALKAALPNAVVKVRSFGVCGRGHRKVTPNGGEWEGNASPKTGDSFMFRNMQSTFCDTK